MINYRKYIAVDQFHLTNNDTRITTVIGSVAND